MRRRALAAAVGSFTFAAAVPAQRVMSSVDISGTGIWYADSIRSAGTSVTPAFRIDWPSATLGAFGSLSRLGSGGSSFQGMLSQSVFTPSAGPFSGELAASLGGSSHQ